MYKLPQAPSEREREADRLLLEFAVKKCALTLSKDEILSLADRTLTEIFNQEVDAIVAKYCGKKDVPSSGNAPSASPAKKREPPATPAPSAPPAGSRDAPAQRHAGKAGQVAEKQKKKKAFLWGDLLFYGVLIALLVGVVLLAGNGKQGPRSFAGFTVQTVLTSSMESVFPKGSLVISRYTDPDTLEIGDDITFMASQDTTISHRIIGIVENYADTGQRAFKTQGVMNAAPDSELVPAVNVVGKVVFHSYAAGKAVDFVKSYWPLLLFFLVVLAVLIRVLRYIYGKEDGGRPAAANGPDQKTQKRNRRGKHPLPANSAIQMQGGQP
ncbi:MAG TPA: signal peptidase I [Firmicutes bacterium]|nr:signal peptidase I [Bacillota bacterium]